MRRRAFRGSASDLRPAWDPRYAGTTADPGLAGDSPYTALPEPAAADTLRKAAPARRDSAAADTSRKAAPARRDTLRGRFDR